MPKPRIAKGRLYGFIDTAYLGQRDPAEVTRAMIEGGVDVIQVRAKDLTHPQRVKLGLAVVGVAFRYEVPVIVNDDIEAAFEVGADGVHLGQDDWAEIPREMRVARLANMRIVGISTHSLEQAFAAERDGADYIGVGPVFSTATKPGVPPVGVELVQEVTGRVAVPFFSIGGITLDNIDSVLAAGATRVAVVSAILQAPEVAKAAEAFKKKLTRREGD
jgi:thiamine-phosphate pyrophosphorylase